MVPLFIETILMEPEGGKYVVPLLTATLSELVSGRRGSSSGIKTANIDVLVISITKH